MSRKHNQTIEHWCPNKEIFDIFGQYKFLQHSYALNRAIDVSSPQDILLV